MLACRWHSLCHSRRDCALRLVSHNHGKRPGHYGLVIPPVEDGALGNLSPQNIRIPVSGLQASIFHKRWPRVLCAKATASTSSDPATIMAFSCENNDFVVVKGPGVWRTLPFSDRRYRCVPLSTYSQRAGRLEATVLAAMDYSC